MGLLNESRSVARDDSLKADRRVDLSDRFAVEILSDKVAVQKLLKRGFEFGLIGLYDLTQRLETLEGESEALDGFS